MRGQDKGNAQKSDIRDVYDCGGDCAHLKNNPRWIYFLRSFDLRFIKSEGSRQRKSKNPIQDKRNAQISDIRDVYDCGEDCAHLKNNPR